MYKSFSTLGTYRKIQKGEILFVEGGFDNRLYFLLDGQIGQYKKKAMKPEFIQGVIGNQFGFISTQREKDRQRTLSQKSKLKKSQRNKKVLSLSNNNIFGSNKSFNEGTRPTIGVRFDSSHDINSPPVSQQYLNVPSDIRLENSVKRSLNFQDESKLPPLARLSKILKRMLFRESIERRLNKSWVNNDWKVFDKKHFFYWINLLAWESFKERWVNHCRDLIKLQTMTPGDSYGEFMLLRDKPSLRACSAIAEADGEILQIDISQVFMITSAEREEKIGLEQDFQQEFKLFQKINRHTQSANFESLEKVDYEYSRYVYKEGDTCEFIYAVLEGRFLEAKKISVSQISNLKKLTNQNFHSPWLKEKNISKNIEVRLIEGGLTNVKDCLLEGKHSRSLKCVSERGLVLQIKRRLVKNVLLANCSQSDFEELGEFYDQEFENEFFRKIEFLKKHQNELIGFLTLIGSEQSGSIIKKSLMQGNFMVKNQKSGAQKVGQKTHGPEADKITDKKSIIDKGHTHNSLTTSKKFDHFQKTKMLIGYDPALVPAGLHNRNFSLPEISVENLFPASFRAADLNKKISDCRSDVSQTLKMGLPQIPGRIPLSNQSPWNRSRSNSNTRNCYSPTIHGESYNSKSPEKIGGSLTNLELRQNLSEETSNFTTNPKELAPILERAQKPRQRTGGQHRRNHSENHSVSAKVVKDGIIIFTPKIIHRKSDRKISGDENFFSPPQTNHAISLIQENSQRTQLEEMQDLNKTGNQNLFNVFQSQSKKVTPRINHICSAKDGPNSLIPKLGGNKTMEDPGIRRRSYFSGHFVDGVHNFVETDLEDQLKSGRLDWVKIVPNEHGTDLANAKKNYVEAAVHRHGGDVKKTLVSEIYNKKGKSFRTMVEVTGKDNSIRHSYKKTFDRQTESPSKKIIRNSNIQGFDQKKLPINADFLRKKQKFIHKKRQKMDDTGNQNINMTSALPKHEVDLRVDYHNKLNKGAFEDIIRARVRENISAAQQLGLKDASPGNVFSNYEENSIPADQGGDLKNSQNINLDVPIVEQEKISDPICPITGFLNAGFESGPKVDGQVEISNPGDEIVMVKNLNANIQGKLRGLSPTPNFDQLTPQFQTKRSTPGLGIEMDLLEGNGRKNSKENMVMGDQVEPTCPPGDILLPTKNFDQSTLGKSGPLAGNQDHAERKVISISNQSQNRPNKFPRMSIKVVPIGSMKNSINAKIFEPKIVSRNSWRSDQSKPVQGGKTVADLDNKIGSLKNDSGIYQNGSSFINPNSPIPNPDFNFYDQKFDVLGSNNSSFTPGPENVSIQCLSDSGQILEQGIYESSRYQNVASSYLFKKRTGKIASNK